MSPRGARRADDRIVAETAGVPDRRAEQAREH
jgi:hypothetical protein